MSTKAKRNRVSDLWLQLPQTWRIHLVSAFNTFVSAFVTEILWLLSTSTDFSITRTALFGALSVAVRSIAVKPATTLVIPEVLPDTKK
jgi:hypothetical protein